MIQRSLPWVRDRRPIIVALALASSTLAISPASALAPTTRPEPMLAAPPLAAVSPAIPPTPTDLDYTIEKRRLRDILTKASAEDVFAHFKSLAESGDPVTALRLILPAIESLDETVQQLADERDSQGDRLFRTYLRGMDLERGRWKSGSRIDEYHAALEVSGELNTELIKRVAVVDNVVLMARLLSATGASSVASSATLLQETSQLLRKTQPATSRRALMDSLGPSLVAGLEEDLSRLVVGTKDAVVRPAALRALSRAPTSPAVQLATMCLADSDPHARRAAIRVLAGAGTRPAIDALVEQLASEGGVPIHEIFAELGRLSGERFGPHAASWRHWWSLARDEWTGPVAGESDLAEPASPTWDYFGLRLLSKRVVFVLDRSGSMLAPLDMPELGERRAADARIRWDLARHELARALRGLGETASFGIVTYGTTVDAFADRLVEATERNVDKALAWIDEFDVVGATNISGALRAAFAMTEPCRRCEDFEIADTIVLLSDGEPTCGPITFSEAIVAEAARVNPDGMVAVHTICLGDEADADFMQALAEKGGGQFVHHKQ